MTFRGIINSFSVSAALIIAFYFIHLTCANSLVESDGPLPDLSAAEENYSYEPPDDWAGVDYSSLYFSNVSEHSLADQPGLHDSDEGSGETILQNNESGLQGILIRFSNAHSAPENVMLRVYVKENELSYSGYPLGIYKFEDGNKTEPLEVITNKQEDWEKADITGLIQPEKDDSLLLIIPLTNDSAKLSVTEIQVSQPGNKPPKVSKVVVDDDITAPGNQIDLASGGWKTVHCDGVATDNDGYQDITNASAVFFDTAKSYNDGADDNNLHYSNSSCYLAAGSGKTRDVRCTFSVWYYANPGSWRCNLTARDSQDFEGSGYDATKVNRLVSLSIPNTIDYGALEIQGTSEQRNVPVTNYGNVDIDIALDGYGNIDGDGLAMNCTGGGIKNITLSYERYNATAAGLSWDNMVPLTDSPATQTSFDLGQRTDDLANSTKNTYWRLKVPSGVDGTCKGHVVFTAVIS